MYICVIIDHIIFNALLKKNNLCKQLVHSANIFNWIQIKKIVLSVNPIGIHSIEKYMLHRDKVHAKSNKNSDYFYQFRISNLGRFTPSFRSAHFIKKYQSASWVLYTFIMDTTKELCKKIFIKEHFCLVSKCLIKCNMSFLKPMNFSTSLRTGRLQCMYALILTIHCIY